MRAASPEDRAELTAILDAAMLQTDAEQLHQRVAAGEVLIARSDTDGRSAILGTLVLDGDEITAIAVRPGRRGQGIGRALVAAAARRRDRLLASFDPGVRDFYDSLGFEIDSAAESNRLQGSLDGLSDGGLAGVE